MEDCTQVLTDGDGAGVGSVPTSLMVTFLQSQCLAEGSKVQLNFIQWEGNCEDHNTILKSLFSYFD